MYFLWYLLIGLVAGWLANLLVSGHGSGLVVNLIVGIVGGILGGWILSLLGLVAVGTLGSLIASVVGAVVLSGSHRFWHVPQKTLLAMNKEKIQRRHRPNGRRGERDDESAVGQNRPGDPLRKRKGRTNQTTVIKAAAPDDRRRTRDRRLHRRAYSGQTVRE